MRSYKIRGHRNLKPLYITNSFYGDCKAYILSKSFSTPESELASMNRNHLETVSLLLSSAECGKMIGFICIDLYRTNRGVCGKVLNMYISSEWRNRGLAKKMCKMLVNISIKFVKSAFNAPLEIIIAHVVGCFKDETVKILQSSNFEISSKGRGMIPMALDMG